MTPTTRPCTIYTLTEPSSGEVRYIGKTVKKLHRRLTDHIWEARSGQRNYRCNWIRSLLPQRPIITALMVVSEQDSADAEMRTIARYRADGFRLVNTTDGGDGTIGWVPSAEMRAKISAVHKGRRRSPEHSALMLQILGGPEHRESERLRVTALWADPAYREKMLRALRAPSRRAKISASKKGRKFSPEHCHALSLVRKGVKGRGRNAKGVPRPDRAGQLNPNSRTSRAMRSA